MSPEQPKPTRSPLSRSVFHVLLALSAGPNHGLGIADDVEAETDGAISLGPGTLYRALKQMVERGLIVETPAPDADADTRRRHYRLTPLGREALHAEAERYRKLVATLDERNVIPGDAAS